MHASSTSCSARTRIRLCIIVILSGSVDNLAASRLRGKQNSTPGVSRKLRQVSDSSAFDRDATVTVLYVRPHSPQLRNAYLSHAVIGLEPLSYVTCYLPVYSAIATQ